MGKKASFDPKDIVLGCEAKDIITGYTGIVTGVAKYLYGCTQYVIVPPVNAQGQLQGGEWFDEGRLRRTSARVIAPKEVKGDDDGGPQPWAPQGVK